MLRNLTLTILLAVALSAPTVGAQAQPVAAAAQAPALDQVDCRTLLRLSGEERGYTIIYLHGFVSGRKGLTQFPAQDLAEATDRVVEQCIDKPGDKLLAVFERVRAK
ncbi:MAG: HdeA family protein [Burkholderiaceae bacterium]|nr:HdeA family protein [Burkholderiaceae bacterium]